MAIHRGKRPEQAFTILANAVLRDDRLSYRARGILAVILSHAEDWSTTSEALAAAGKEGRDAVRTALTELEDAGYLRREKHRGRDGRIATRQVVYDQPHAIQESLFPGMESPGTGNQASVNQASGNQAPIEVPGEEPSPSGKGAPPPNQVATRVYDHAQGMVNFMAVRQVAASALKVKVGSGHPTVDQVSAVMCQLYDNGKPIILSTVGQALARGGFRQTNDSHWAAGGQF